MADLFGVHFEKLNGESNFQTWRYAVKLVLEQHKLLEIVDGRHKSPEPFKTVVDHVETVINSEAIEAWRKKDLEAMIILFTSVSLKQQEYLITCKTSNDIWERISVLYLPESFDMHKKFHTYKYVPGHNMISHVTALQSYAAWLEELGEPLDDSTIMWKIVNTLPFEYRAFRSVWNFKTEKEKTVTALLGKLLAEERMQEHYKAQSTSNGSSSQALKRPAPAGLGYVNNKIKTSRKWDDDVAF